MRKVFIYVLINPLNNQIFYVGYTKNPKTRLNAHITKKCNPLKDKIINDILKLNLRPELKIIDSCDYVYNSDYNMYEHERLEIYYIKKYREEGIKLTNLTDGGGDTNSTLKIKVFKYDQFGNYINEYLSIADASIEHNINPTNIGHAVNQRVKKTSCGYYWFTSKEKAENFQFEINWKDDLPILQYSLDGEFIKEFKNKRDAEKILNLKRDCITRALKSNNLSSAGGYLWFYKGNLPKIINKYKLSFTKEISQYDLNGNFIQKFNSIKEASKKLNICDVTIISCAKGKFSQAGGYIWYYSNNLPNNIKPYKKKIYGIPVLKFSINNELLDEYPSIKTASEHNKISWDVISYNLKGKTKTAGGFIWKYKNINKIENA